jgi:hypothetical protein
MPAVRGDSVRDAARAHSQSRVSLIFGAAQREVSSRSDRPAVQRLKGAETDASECPMSHDRGARDTAEIGADLHAWGWAPAGEVLARDHIRGGIATCVVWLGAP